MRAKHSVTTSSQVSPFSQGGEPVIPTPGCGGREKRRGILAWLLRLEPKWHHRCYILQHLLITSQASHNQKIFVDFTPAPKWRSALSHLFLVRWERVPPCLTVSVISSASETLGHNVQSGLTILSGRGARYPIEKLWAPLSLRCGCAHNR